MSLENTAYHFLQDGGEMGKLIRAKDWSQTPLGKPENWPQSLKNMVKVLLDNPFGQNIVWGQDYTQIYNDGYIPILGSTKHPQALGSSAKDTWSEVWHIIGPMFETVMKGESISFTDFFLQLNRNGYLENCYFDFAYSPIKLENGEVGGALVTIIETTTKKKVQDDLKENRDELEFVIEAAQLGTFDYNPITNKFSGNTRLKDWFGLPHNEEIELIEAINSIAEKDRERISNAVLEALKYESGGTYNVKYTVVNKVTKKETFIHSKGRTWFNEDKEAYRFTGTLEDITEQTAANIRTKETENHIRTMILESPIGICVLDAATLICETVNESFVEIAGKPREQIIGNFYWDTFEEVKDLHVGVLDKVLETGEAVSAYEVELILIRNGKKEKVYVSFVYAPLKDKNEKVIKVAVWVQNNTPQVEIRKEILVSEHNLRLMILQAPIAIAIFRGTDYNVEIANNLALELWNKTEEQVLGIPLFESMPELLPQGIKELLDEVRATGKRFFTPEMPVKLFRDGSLKKIYINFSFEPLFDANRNINGIMAIGFDVTEGVEARKKVEKSEQGLRALVESAPFPIGVYEGEELRITLLNKSIMDIWGKGYDLIGKTYPEVLPELEEQNIYEQLRGVIRTGIPFHAKNQRVDLMINGELKPHYFNYSFTPLFDTEGEVYAVMNTAAEVTELHEAKQKVEESEKRFRESVKQAPIGITILRGPENIVEMANENYLLIVDRAEDQFVGKPLFESLPEVKESVSSIISDVYKSGNAFYGYEFPVLLNRYGKMETSYFNFVYHPIKENNVITGIMVVATDVTTTIIARQQIEENEEKLELVIESSELGVFDVDLKTSDIVASERCYQILGFKDERNLTNKELLKNFHPDDLRIRKQAFKKAFIDGKLDYQARILWNDGTLHWMEAKGKVFFDDKGKPERLLGTIRDITEERNFQQELSEREEKFRLLADFMPQYIWTADPDGNLTYFNQSTYDFGGFEPGTLNNEGWINMVHPDDREENLKRWMHSVKTGENYLFEQRFRRYDGEYRWQLSRAIPQRDSNGVIKRWVGTSTDIQEQKMFTKELEKQVHLRTKELEEKNLDLEKMNKQLQSFVFISSHDLQEPLRKIQMFSSRILENEHESLSSNGQKYFERIENSAFRMQQLIKDLIEYSRTDIQEKTYEKINLNELIEEVKELLSEELEQKKVKITSTGICEVRVVPVQFRQVVLNLISNSIKYAKANEPAEITIDCAKVLGKETNVDSISKDTLYSHIRFTDNGIGFEQEYNERIFEVFQRLHTKDTYSGTGIGLSIVKKIIENHDGAITASGNLDQGAVFDIYIPAP